jgi:anti-sigma B factor antagonist
VQEFSVRTRQPDPETAVLVLAGEVDLLNAPAYQAELNRQIEAGASRVVIDLEQATFFDSTALRVLLEGHRELLARNGTISLVCSKPRLRKIFAITGLEELFPFHATVEQALAAPRRLDAVA